MVGDSNRGFYIIFKRRRLSLSESSVKVKILTLKQQNLVEPEGLA